MTKNTKTRAEYLAGAAKYGETVGDAEFSQYDCGIAFGEACNLKILDSEKDAESYAQEYANGVAKRGKRAPLTGKSLSVYVSGFRSFAYPAVYERRESIDEQILSFVKGKTKKQCHDKGLYQIALQMNSMVRKAKPEDLAKMAINSKLIASTIAPRFGPWL